MVKKYISKNSLCITGSVIHKYVFELIDIVQKGNKDKIIDLLIIFQNQIKSYSKKARSEDVEQDLYVF